METNFCVKCKKEGKKVPVWKGTKYYHNFWQLYCRKHEDEEHKIFSDCFNTVYSPAKTAKQISEEIDILRRSMQ